jgi:hypothetical protein
MINLMEFLSGAVSLIGSCAVVVMFSLLFSPYLCRLTASALESHAVGIDAYRKTRTEYSKKKETSDAEQ